MKTEIYINEGIHESRIAILEDGQLAEIWIERPENERMVGDIYKGTVNAVLPSLQAAFIEMGLERTAFLQVRDMMEAESVEIEEGGRGNRRSRNYPQIQDILNKGQELLVQITKEPISTKGARVTTQISLPGRFVVLVPGGGEWVGVSRKIASLQERRRLRDLVNDLRPEGYAVIIRTEGRKKSEREFRRDIKELQKTYERMIKKSKKLKPPALVHKEMGMTSSVIRDLFNENVERVVVDSKARYQEILEYVRAVSPELKKRIEYYRERKPIFDAFKIEQEIEKLNDRTVWMRKGGGVVIDHAEAGTFIDVNSARSVGTRDQEENNLNTNLEAVSQIARQLRLRDIGGIIVIDFIDMHEERNRRRVIERLIDEMKKDRAKVSISPQISEFGLVEMTRQRVRANLLHTHSEPCPTCDGTGRVMGPDTTLTKIERWLQRSYAASGERKLVLKINPEVAGYLTEAREGRIKALRKATKARLELQTDSSLKPQEYRFLSAKSAVDLTRSFNI